MSLYRKEEFTAAQCAVDQMCNLISHRNLALTEAMIIMENALRDVLLLPFVNTFLFLLVR